MTLWSSATLCWCQYLL